MKRKISFIVALSMILTLALSSSVFAAKNSSDNFVKYRKYENQFADVSSSAWYADSVSSAYEYGLVSGTSETSYNPSGNVSIAETIVLACRLNNIYCEKNEKFEGGGKWYQPYVDYALENKIIDKAYADYNTPATRREFAKILSSSLPNEAFTAINKITEIPDVTSNEDNIYKLYNAGIVAGSDKYGTFNPTSNIKRSEVAAIIVRVADKTQRKKFELEKKPVEVESIALSNTSVSMTAGETENIEATISPANATDKNITYTSSNASVASVSSKGEIKALKEGNAVITATTGNGKKAHCNVEVTKRTPVNTTVYEDSKVKITFLRVEKYKYDDDEVKVYCDVENKTNETLTIQCDALSLNGYNFNNVIMSDDISAHCIGTVDTTLKDFNFSWVDINNITSFGGQYRIISDNKTFKTYPAVFINQNLFENKTEKNYPKVSGKELLYSDKKVNMYFDYAENDDEDLEVYLTVQNKTNETILIQNDTVVINRRSYDRTIMSDEVLPYSTGNVNVTIRDAAMGSVSTIGGDFRIISDADSFRTYTATLGKSTASKDDDDDGDDDDSNSRPSSSAANNSKAEGPQALIDYISTEGKHKGIAYYIDKVDKKSDYKYTAEIRYLPSTGNIEFVQFAEKGDIKANVSLTFDPDSMTVKDNEIHGNFLSSNPFSTVSAVAYFNAKTVSLNTTFKFVKTGAAFNEVDSIYDVLNSLAAVAVTNWKLLIMETGIDADSIGFSSL